MNAEAIKNPALVTAGFCFCTGCIACNQNRTGDLIITSDALYQLSYAGNGKDIPGKGPFCQEFCGFVPPVISDMTAAENIIPQTAASTRRPGRLFVVNAEYPASRLVFRFSRRLCKKAFCSCAAGKLRVNNSDRSTTSDTHNFPPLFPAASGFAASMCGQKSAGCWPTRQKPTPCAPACR